MQTSKLVLVSQVLDKKFVVIDLAVTNGSKKDSYKLGKKVGFERAAPVDVGIKDNTWGCDHQAVETAPAGLRNNI